MIESEQQLLEHLERISGIMDNGFSILGIPIGLDAIIGLAPVAGDVIGGLISLYVIYRSREFEFEPNVYNKMLRNVIIDVFVGSVPVIGDLFDVFFTVNARNLKLIKRELEKRGAILAT